MMYATMEMARSAGLDAGNRSMRKGGRTQWNEDDQDAATEAYLKVAALVPAPHWTSSAAPSPD